MARVYEIDGVVPVVDPSAWVHPEAVLIGDVIIGPECYIGPCASLRGDFGRIVVERGANIQDTCVIHAFPDEDVVVEESGHIGHGAVLHGCRIGRNALVGMNAVVMDHAVVGENSFVAAMAFVKAGMQIAPNTLVAGTPARVIRELGAKEIGWKTEGTATYVDLVRRSRDTLREATPLTAVEADRKRVQVGPVGVTTKKQTDEQA